MGVERDIDMLSFLGAQRDLEAGMPGVDQCRRLSSTAGHALKGLHRKQLYPSTNATTSPSAPSSQAQ